MSPNQAERARVIEAEIEKIFHTLHGLHQDLDLLLDEAQNAPPDGTSDGSISEEWFNELAKLRRSLTDLLGYPR